MMRSRDDLVRILNSIDGRGYSSYKQLRGTYDLSGCRLAVDHVQVDPYAPPSKLRLLVARADAALPADLIDTPDGRVAVSDFLTRRLAEAIQRLSPPPAGRGAGGAVAIPEPGQQVLERTIVLIADDCVEARLDVSLPASGRRVRGREAFRILTDILPRIADAALRHMALDAPALRHHVTLFRDQEHLRCQLADRGLVAFIGDGAVLPRRSGASDLPLEGGTVPFASPESLRVDFDLPSGRTVTGMGIAEGVTVIVGGGYHGKSTLLRAIERGVYSHIAGDGREWAITRRAAVTIRAEDGRAVTGVDISPFIGNLPSGTDTGHFTTPNASGSTSQAANLAEALEAGTPAILVDEDTSATNFMIRDELMRQLVPSDREPITPFVDRIRPLFSERGVSTVLVAGGSGAFFGVADHVIALDAYVPRDVTALAHEIARKEHSDAEVPGTSSGHEPGERVFGSPRPRVPTARSLQPLAKTKPARARGRDVVQYGRETIDLSAVVQLVDPAQTEALARILDRLAELADGERDLSALVAEVDRRIDRDGLDALSPHSGHPGYLARPRRYEIHAALNRCRRLGLR